MAESGQQDAGNAAGAACGGTTSGPAIKPSLQAYRRQLLICVGPYCTGQGMTNERVRQIGRQLLENGLLDDGPSCVKPTLARCLGACEGGPILCVHPEASWYFGVDTHRFERILTEHLQGGQVVEDFLFHQGPTA